MVLQTWCSNCWPQVVTGVVMCTFLLNFSLFYGNFHVEVHSYKDSLFFNFFNSVKAFLGSYIAFKTIQQNGNNMWFVKMLAVACTMGSSKTYVVVICLWGCCWQEVTRNHQQPKEQPTSKILVQTLCLIQIWSSDQKGMKYHQIMYS